MQSILVTGASGFVGGALVARLQAESRDVVGTTRRAAGGRSTLACTGELAAETDWSAALAGRGVVIHAAALVHVMNHMSTDPLAKFRRANVEGTLSLARQAAAAGVKRFIFISSIKVNGEGAPLGSAYTPEDAPYPGDAYGISKKEAEDGLRQIAADTEMEVVIIRPPLVYGPGVKANFLSMMRWLHSGVPLPLGSIPNKRSLVALDNLVDLIATCIEHPAAANQTFLVSDGEDLSTTELLQRMGAALGKPARLLPVPPELLSAGATLLGKRAVAQRLLGSLQVDISKTRTLLDWTPPVSVHEALHKTAAEFLAKQPR
jgi:nucleoside-diphosphate-sugar epimerase